VDDQLHLAAVVNSADNTLSIVNLQNPSQTPTTFSLPSNPTGTSPAPTTPTPPPFSIGVNPLTHRALVAYSSTNIATVVDLSTNQVVCILGGSNPSMPNNCSTIPLSNTRPVSTGPAPLIAVEPQLNWAIVTPGGAGAISLVDLGTPATGSQVARIPNVNASLTITTGIRGVSINTETEEALFTDPNQSNLTQFSVLDQTVSTIALDRGEVASAVNPLTDVGVVVNNVAGTATVVDLQTRQKIASVSVGTSPVALAVDPAKNVAVIANQGSNNVSILPLGPILSPQITEISAPTTFTAPASGSLVLNVTGFGFASSAVVRLDGTSVPTAVSANGRQATAIIPGSMLSTPRRFALDVMNPGGAISNEENFTVIGAVPVGLNPIGVAIDPTLNEALVTVKGAVDPSTGACAGPGTASVVNLATVAVLNSFTVGTCPEGIATAPRLGRAVVANNGSGDATVLDYVNNVVLSTVKTGNGPMGVAIQPDTSTVAVANFTDNSVSVFTIGSSVGASSSTVPVDQGPIGVGVDPDDNLLAVTAATQNTVDIINLGSHFITGRLVNFQNPTDVAFDPITGTFLVANSLANNIGIADPVTLVASPIQASINPTAIAYNFQSSTAVTVNRATNTMSVLDFLATNNNGVLSFVGRQVRAILPMGGSDEFSVAINPLTNVAAVVDQVNGRLLLIPLPR
jgi:YVTN family beta-propeller protein